MKSRILPLALLIMVLALAGCATRGRMAFEDDSERLNEKSPPVFLMTVTLRNSFNTQFQPRLMIAHLEKAGAAEAPDRLSFKMDAKARNETDSEATGNSYLLRLPLEPGNYEIRGLTSTAHDFPVRGFFFTPLHSPLEVREGGVYYLGHIKATVRKRRHDEFRAGPITPLLNQAVVGGSTGTFDVDITDEFVTDEVRFRKQFPALAGIPIRKAILPPFDRARVQMRQK